MSGTDPMKPSEPTPRDIRPFVAGPVSRRGIWLFASLAVVGGSALFAALESHRALISAPAIAPTGDDMSEASGILSSPPPLAIPPDYAQQVVAPAPTGLYSPAAEPAALQNPPASRRVPAPLPQAPSAPAISRPSTVTDPDSLAAMRIGSTPPGTAPRPELVYDASRDAAKSRPAAPTANGAEAGEKEERVEASRFANPSTTVPKGTVIQAVLETALDSTRAGFARAIVSRDVYAFDGKRVMIARGSRLIGDYKADLAAGQKRALIQWQRLMRPDGVVINLASPSADPLGRAGVKGKVNSHFIEKFGGAILQSALNIGTQVGVNKIANGSVIYAVPLMTQTVPTIQQDKVTPTLTVRQGTSVSVFVAKDLDFTAVE